MMQMVLAAAQADPVLPLPTLDPLKLARRPPLPPPSLSRRKRPSELDGIGPEMNGIHGGWIEETDPHAKYLFRYDPSLPKQRDGDPNSDEGVNVEPSGRRVERKDRKNKREQERRKEINDRFALLSDLLFGSKFSGRVDKTQILDRAIDLVRHGPSILRNNENLVMDPLPPDGGDPLAGRENWPGDMPKNLHLPPGMRYRDSCSPSCAAPHCHEPEMNHLKYVQSPYAPSPYPQYPQNGHPSHPSSYSSGGYQPPFFQQPQFAPSHANFSIPPKLSDPAHQMCVNRGRGGNGRCFDCESDSSGNSPEMRNYRNMASSGSSSSSSSTNHNNNGACRAGCHNHSHSSSGNGVNGNGSTLMYSNAPSHWGGCSQNGTSSSSRRKDDVIVKNNHHNNSHNNNSVVSNNDDDDDESDDDPSESNVLHTLEPRDGQCNSSRSSISISGTVSTRHFSENRSSVKTRDNSSSSSHLPPPSRTKGGFDPLLKGDASIGMQVALLDTLVQLSQNSKRVKK